MRGGGHPAGKDNGNEIINRKQKRYHKMLEKWGIRLMLSPIFRIQGYVAPVQFCRRGASRA
jgi:hypothetical protein